MPYTGVAAETNVSFILGVRVAVREINALSGVPGRTIQHEG
jgi:ABC-type branched-subunit amino acid transport system substrate-binding protein